MATVLDGDGGLYRWVRVVVGQLEVLEFEIVDVLHGGVELHRRQAAWLAGELKSRLLNVVGVKVQIAESVDELTGFQPGDLRDHEREQRVTGDIEGHPQKDIRAALVKLAAQFAFAHIKLEQRVARRQGHGINLARVPRGDDQ